MFISQTTDSHFANYRFSFRKLQISISQTTDFHFVSSHFVSFHFVSSHFVSQTTVGRTDEANSMAFLQREFLPSNDTYTTKTSAGNTSFPAFVYLYKTLKLPCSKVNKKATMMYFIGSFEYRVTFLVKLRRFNGHRKWTFCIVRQWFFGKIFRQIVSVRHLSIQIWWRQDI